MSDKDVGHDEGDYQGGAISTAHKVLAAIEPIVYAKRKLTMGILLVITALKLLKSAEALPIRFVQRGRERSATITPMADPKLTIVRGETAGAVPTQQQLAFRHAWLGQD